MANRVKGITIEINGDTTGLSKSLSGINKEINSTKSELKDIERLLKLDPSNVELLEQKQKNLAKQIDLTSQKLKALKEAEKQVQQQFEKGDISEQQYNALKREIIATETSLNKLEDTAEKTSKAIKETAKEGTKGFTELQKKAEKVGETLSKIGDKATAAGEKMSGVSKAAAGVLAGAAALVTTTADDSAGFAKLETNAKNAGVEMTYLEEAMRRLYAVTQETDSNIEGLSNLMQAGYTDTGLLQAVDLLSGAVIKFPDTLKIESLADSLQETLETRKATGQFAELLDRLGVGADKFNEKLAKTGSEAARMDLALQTLSQAGLAAVNEQYFEANETLTTMLMGQSDLNKSMVELGDALRPLAAELLPMLVEMIKMVVGFITSMDTGTLKIIVGVVALVAALAPLLTIIGQVITAFKTISVVMTALAGSPTAIIIAAIAAVAAGLIWLEKETQIFSKAFTAIWEGVQKVIEKISNFFIKIFTEKIPNALKKMQDFFKSVWESLVNIVKVPANLIISMINGIIKSLNKFMSWANNLRLPKLLGGGSLGFNFKMIDEIPLLAKGGILSQGSAIVGERGAEMLTVKNGKAIVQPLGGSTAHSAAGNTFYFNVNANDIQSVADFWRVTQSAKRLGRMV